MGNIVENIEIELIKETEIGQFIVKYTSREMMAQVAMHVSVDGQLIEGAPFVFDIEKSIYFFHLSFIPPFFFVRVSFLK